MDALQAGQGTVVHVTAELDPDAAERASVDRRVRVLGAVGGARRMVLPRMFEQPLRKAALLSGVSSREVADNAEITAADGPHWSPSRGAESPHFSTVADVSIVCDHREFRADGIPPQLTSSMMPVASLGAYLPTVFVNPVEPPSDRFIPLNGTFTTVPLDIKVQVVPPSRFALMHVMTQALRSMDQGSAGSMRKELDDVNRLVTETPVWLLATTMAVSVLHLWLDVLAIQSDISFWASTSTLSGVSVSTLATQAVSEVVVALYLWDEGASFLVFGPAAAFACIQGWKLARALSLRAPVSATGSSKLSAEKQWSNDRLARTAEYDMIATTHMALALAPLVLGGTLFSLLVQEHDSWWHWGLQTAVSVVYSLGFALMTPQLYINYRLRSVAALNWPALMYRTIGTFIDDLFAFVIRAPAMHRLSVFRDDAIFVLYIYQRWIYPVDRSRVDTGSIITDTRDDASR